MSSVIRFALILLAAAVFAVIARVWFVSKQNSVPPQVKTTRIRMTTASLPAGLLLRDAELGWKAVPADEIPTGALSEGSDAARLNGSLLRTPLEAGKIILAGDVIRPDAPGFLAAALKPGMRAISVPVDDVSGNAGLIEPGDFVDIILTQRLRNAENDLRQNLPQVVSETVVERVRIIAVGSNILRQQEDADKKVIRARTVTVELAPRAAEALTVAAQLGTLSMALRSFAVDARNLATGDEANDVAASVVAWDQNRKEEQRPVWGGDVSRALGGDTPPSATTENHAEPAKSQRVIIMRGSQRQEQEFATYAH